MLGLLNSKCKLWILLNPTLLIVKERMKRAVITGTAGFIGSRLTEKLLSKGETIVGIDNFDPWYSPQTKEQNLLTSLQNENFSLKKDDLLSVDLNSIFQEEDVVYHLAGRPGVQDSWGSGFSPSVENNILATQRVFEAALASGVKRVVFASSSSVYGASATSLSSEVNPISPYGVTKAACEQLAQVYRFRGLDVMVMRYFTVYGPRQRPDMAMNRLFRAALPGDYVFPLRGTGAQRREFTFVEDIVDATIRAGSLEIEAVTEPFDIGGGVSASLSDVIDQVEQIVGSSIRVDHQPAAKGDPLITVADTEPAEKILGWRASTDLQTGLKKHFDSFMETPLPTS